MPQCRPHTFTYIFIFILSYVLVYLPVLKNLIIIIVQAISTNFKNSYQLIETCYAPETCTVALTSSYSTNLECKLIKSCTQRCKGPAGNFNLTNFKNSYQLIETCYAPEICTVALSTLYSINDDENS